MSTDSTSTAAPGARAPLLGSVLAALGASACCAGPLLLVMLGAGGAWAARLRALEPLRPLFLAVTLVLVGWAFYRLYIAPRRCAPGQLCAAPGVLRRQRTLFWFTVTLIAALLLFPLAAPLFY